MALEGVKSDKSEEHNGNVPDAKQNGNDIKSKQVLKLTWIFLFAQFFLTFAVYFYKRLYAAFVVVD